jgi:hypothetical protein
MIKKPVIMNFQKMEQSVAENVGILVFSQNKKLLFDWLNFLGLVNLGKIVLFTS